MAMTTATEISNRIMEAVMAQKLAPGSRLGEQQLAMLFDCSRTIVREALMRLSTRGIVTVSARRGWYVIEPSQDEAREAFEARRVIELGLLHQLITGALGQQGEHARRHRRAVAPLPGGQHQQRQQGDAEQARQAALGGEGLSGQRHLAPAR